MVVKCQTKAVQQTILEKCRTAVAKYCSCDVVDIHQHIDDLDWVDMYEICLDVALRVKGKKAMSWEEFLTFRENVRSSLSQAA